MHSTGRTDLSAVFVRGEAGSQNSIRKRFHEKNGTPQSKLSREKIQFPRNISGGGFV